jgi:cell division protein FtsL
MNVHIGRVQVASGQRRKNIIVSVLEQTNLISTKMLLVVLILIALLASGISLIYTTFKNRYLLNEIQELKQQRNELQVHWGQLLIEQSTFSLEGRIERKAVEELQMKVPEIADIIMVRYE